MVTANSDQKNQTRQKMEFPVLLVQPPKMKTKMEIQDRTENEHMGDK